MPDCVIKAARTDRRHWQTSSSYPEKVWCTCLVCFPGFALSYVCFSLFSRSCCCLISRSISVPSVCRFSFEEKDRKWTIHIKCKIKSHCYHGISTACKIKSHCYHVISTAGRRYHFADIFAEIQICKRKISIEKYFFHSVVLFWVHLKTCLFSSNVFKSAVTCHHL